VGIVRTPLPGKPCPFPHYHPSLRTIRGKIGDNFPDFRVLVCMGLQLQNTGRTRFRHGTPAWNRGKTKENDSRMAAISSTLQGHQTSLECRDKIRASLRRGKFITCGECPTIFWVKPSEIKRGRKFCSIACMATANKCRETSEQQREQLSLSHMGSKNPMWKDGRTPTVQKIRNSKEAKQWRRDIFKRDNWTCVLCNQHGGNPEADHYPRTFQSLIKELVASCGVENLFEAAVSCAPLWDTNNGRTLCYNCHRG
jgi:hypothetical protein